MIYNVVLISILLIASLEEIHSEKKNVVNDGRKTLILSSTILVTVAGCRYQDYYSDFLINYNHMIRMKSISWVECFSESNVGHAFFRKIIIEVLKNPQWYFFITSLFIVGAVIIITKKYSPNFFLSIVLYYTIGIYFEGNNVTRQTVAIAITMIAWKYIMEQKITKYLIVMLVAFSFHTSAVFFVPMYFLSKIPFKKKHLYIYSIIGVISLILRNNIIRFFQYFIYGDYVGQAYGTESSNPLRILLVLVVIFYLVMLLQNRDYAIEYIDQSGVAGGEYLFNFITHGTIIYILLSFFSATIGVGVISQLELIGSLCSLMSRGAIISMFMIIFILPGLLLVFEPVIRKTSKGFESEKKVSKAIN